MYQTAVPTTLVSFAAARGPSSCSLMVLSRTSRRKSGGYLGQPAQMGSLGNGLIGQRSSGSRFGASRPRLSNIARARSPKLDSRLALDPVRVLLCLLILVAISRIHQHFGIVGKFRPAAALTGLALGVALLKPQYVSLRNLSQPLSRLLLAFAVLACISAPFGLSLGGSAAFLLKVFSKVLVFAFLLIVATREPRELRTLIWAGVVSAGILVWMSLFVFEVSEIVGDVTARLGHVYRYDANDAGLVLVASLPLVLLTLQTSRRVGKAVSVTILLGIGLSLARGGSRGAFLGLIVLGIGLVVSARQLSLVKRFALLAVVAVALALAAPAGYWERMKSIAAPSSDYNWTSTDGRVQIAQRGIGYMLDHPVFGLGIDNFRRAEVTISGKVRRSPAGLYPMWIGPHNSYVQVGAELGIPGVLVWLSLVFGGMAAAFRLRRKLPRTWAEGHEDERFLYHASLYVGLSLLAFSVTAFFLSFAYEFQLYLILGYVTGMQVCVSRRSIASVVHAADGQRRRPESVFAGQRSGTSNRRGRWHAAIPGFPHS